MNPLKLNMGCGSRYHDGALWENINYPGNPPKVKHVNLHKGLPYTANTFSFIYTSHVLDHFIPAKTEFIVNEVMRCLKPGGVVRISLPDLEFNCRRYLNSIEENSTNPCKHRWFVIELLDQMTRTQAGGEKAIFLREARKRADIQGWLRPLLGYEMLQHLDRPDPVPPRNMQRVSNWLRGLCYSRQFEKSGERHLWTYDWISLSDLLCRTGFVEITRQSCMESLYKPHLAENLDVENGKEYKPGSLYVEGRKP